ncbi:hypothetical protein ON010_g17040 [Phytophthora cinnamomi]|nr:hypothetical protein ON010_g17040 [Phytophthora cinnamomi]
MKLLGALQDDLRAQMRLEKDELGRNGENKRASGVAIRSLPKTREYWRDVDVSEWCKTELDAACTLLDLPIHGKKLELVARIQDWVHEPEILARLEEQRLLEIQKDAILGWWMSLPAPTGFDANYAFARTDDGQVFAWGGAGHAIFDEAATKGERSKDQQQQQADQHKEDEMNSARGSCFLFPRLISSITNRNLVHLACGRTNGHIAIASDKGACFTWGRGEYGELGTSDCGSKIITEEPVVVEALRKFHVATVSVGNTHTAAITDKGRLYAWGSCWSGQLGLGEAKRAGVKDKRLQLCFPIPTIVEALQQKRITRVSCGAVHTAVVSADGQLFTFGCGDGGRLGLGGNEDSFHPQQVSALEKCVVLDVCCGSWHTLCIARERDETFPVRAPRRVLEASASVNKDSAGGFVYSFGSGLQGQVGHLQARIAASVLPLCLTA